MITGKIEDGRDNTKIIFLANSPNKPNDHLRKHVKAIRIQLENVRQNLFL